MTVIRIENVSFSYPGIPVLRDLSFSVAAGSLLAILGPNGSGKTTLLNLLAGLLRPQCGSIRIADKPLHSLSALQRAKIISLVRTEYLPAFDFTVYETVLMGRTSRLGWFGFETSEDRLAVTQALRDADILPLADRRLDRLSSGQRQRVFIARALAQDTPILLLDEPTAFLDLKHRISILDLLAGLKSQSGKTLLLVTHDLNLAAQYSDNILLLGCDGSYFMGPPNQATDPDRIQSFLGVQGSTSRIDGVPFFIPRGKSPNISPPTLP